MFSGIIETTAKVISMEPQNSSLAISISKPSEWSDLQIGDSIAVNGVCLTLEAFDEKSMQFTLGYETIRLLYPNLNQDPEFQKPVNLERSLKWGDRVHGHFVTGHVESRCHLIEKNQVGASLVLKIKVPENLKIFIVPKGSVALQGVSLTVNQIQDSILEVCLVPETLQRTNLGQLQIADELNIETDREIKNIYHVITESSLIENILKQKEARL